MYVHRLFAPIWNDSNPTLSLQLLSFIPFSLEGLASFNRIWNFISNLVKFRLNIVHLLLKLIQLGSVPSKYFLLVPVFKIHSR